MIVSIDNIKLIYYHALSNLTFNGVKLAGFSADKTDYTITIDGDALKIRCRIIVNGKNFLASLQSGMYQPYQ